MSNSEPRRDPKGTELEYLETISLESEDRALDIGCGDGRLTEYFARGASLVVGTDMKFESIREAQSAHPTGQLRKLHFIASRAESIPFAKQSFSVAIFSWSLWWVSFEGMVHALEESWRVLKTGGRLVDLRPTSPRWQVEVISHDNKMVAGEFDDTTRRREDVASNRAVAEVLSRRLFYEVSIDFFDFEYYWDSVDGMVEHVEYDWLDETTVPENVVEEARRLIESVRGHAEIRIKRKMIIAIYSKLVD